MEKSTKKKIIATSVFSVLAVGVLVGLILATNLMNFYGKALTLFFGEIGGGIDYSAVMQDADGNFIDSQGNIIDTDYYKIDAEFNNADGTFNKEKFVAAQEDLAIRTVGEGTVLLKNDTLPGGGQKSLPLAKQSKVSVFGVTSTWWMTREYFGRDNRGAEFYDALEEAGLSYNAALAQYYMGSTHNKFGVNAFNLGDGGQKGNMSLDEAPWSEIKSGAAGSSFDNYKDAAVVVFSRTASEGGDAPKYMQKFNDAGGEQLTDDYHYLQLTPREKDLLLGIKAEGFTNVIVIFHTGNPMEMAEVDDLATYGVTACLWVAGTGQAGVKGVGKILAGDINPSGHLTDTFAYDNFSAPAMQNYGDFRFTRNNGLIPYSYINYGEGIYVGYKYYETRYEDIVLARANAGSFVYEDEVARPFGYGLSYTDFSWSGYSVSAPDADGNITVSVKVTNEGNVAGKDVVQVYYQAPYTAGGVEKASVNLAGFAKTDMLAASASQTVTVTFKTDDMKSYDEFTDKTYILDGGDYYITAASDAHQAINNILAKKGHTAADKPLMTEDGNAELTAVYTAAAKKTLSGSVGGLTVTNQFRDYTALPDATYLSRNNWAVMDVAPAAAIAGAGDKGFGGLTYAGGRAASQSNTGDSTTRAAFTHAVSDTVYTGLTTHGWEHAGNPNSIDDFPAVESDTDYGHELIDFKGRDYDDPLWDEIIAQIDIDTMADVYKSAGYGTAVIEAINKPLTLEMDGPQGLMAYGGAPVDIGSGGFRYPVQVVFGATWSLALIEEFGNIYAQDCLAAGLTSQLVAGVDGLWAPGVNIHRSPFSGRNWEYFSECGTQTGIMAYTQVKAMSARGLRMQLKHFFLNDQETNRTANGAVATFSNEQAIREIYLKAFQMSIESGESGGVMGSCNRIGYRHPYASYSALVNILRGEWDLKGAVITDFVNLSEDETIAALAGGCDMIDGTGQISEENRAKPGVQYMLSKSLKNICYNAANSLAMNGMVPGSVPVAGFPVYKLLLTFVWIFVCLYILYGAYEVALCYVGGKIPSWTKKKRWIVRGVAIGLAAAVLITVVILFFALWFEPLMFAMQMV